MAYPFEFGSRQIEQTSESDVREKRLPRIRRTIKIRGFDKEPISQRQKESLPEYSWHEEFRDKELDQLLNYPPLSQTLEKENLILQGIPFS